MHLSLALIDYTTTTISHPLSADVIEADSAKGNLLINFLSQNKDTVEVHTSEEDRLAPVYQQLLGLEMREGWHPCLWCSIPLPDNIGQSHHHNVSELMPSPIRKLERIARDQRTTCGMMEMTRLGKYYRNWSGFNVNHISMETLNMMASVRAPNQS